MARCHCSVGVASASLGRGQVILSEATVILRAAKDLLSSAGGSFRETPPAGTLSKHVGTNGPTPDASCSSTERDGHFPRTHGADRRGPARDASRHRVGA